MVCKEPLQRKLVDVNKGDFEKPMVRSRYVATEFANSKSDDFFSPLLSHAACQAPEVAKSW